MQQKTQKMGCTYSFRVECCESWLGLCGGSPHLLKFVGSGLYYNYSGAFPAHICADVL